MAVVCPNCGRQQAEETRFCSSCGALLQAVSAELQDFIRDFQKRLQEHPDDLDARFNLALAYEHAGSLELAREELERCRERQPDSLAVLLELAKVYRRLNRNEEAIAAAEAALAADPKHEKAARLLERMKKD